MFKKNLGYIPDPFDSRLVWNDELFAGEEVRLPDYYKVEGLSYDPQGPYPFCVAMAITTAAERVVKQETGKTVRFSHVHLYFNGGGTKWGSSTAQLLAVAKNKGLIPYEEMPQPESMGSDWYETLRKKALAIPFKDAYKIKGYVGIQPDPESMKQAILQHGPLITGVYASFVDGFYTGDGSRKTKKDNHVLLLAGWDNVVHKEIIFESQLWAKKTDGYVTLNQDYTFNFAYAIPIVMPEDWRAIVEEVRAEPPGVLDHYGQRRNLELEIKTANDLVVAFKKFNNKSVMDAAGRFWTIYINAVAYGGYSLKDVLNDCYNWRRTSKHIFDFNHETRDQWYKRIKGIK